MKQNRILLTVFMFLTMGLGISHAQDKEHCIILKAEEDVAAGENKAYTLTLNTSMTTPVVCFTYRYNKKKYTVEATYSSNL